MKIFFFFWTNLKICKTMCFEGSEPEWSRSLHYGQEPCSRKFHEFCRTHEILWSGFHRFSLTYDLLIEIWNLTKEFLRILKWNPWLSVPNDGPDVRQWRRHHSHEWRSIWLLISQAFFFVVDQIFVSSAMHGSGATVVLCVPHCK